MNATNSIFANLCNPEFKLSKSAKKVAELTLQQPELIIKSSIANVAELAKVSEPTVNRFCHRLGCNGFPEFKVKLAQEIVKHKSTIAQGIEIDDATETFIDKIYDATHASLRDTHAHLDVSSISQAIDIFAKAKSITFFGLGASNSVAQDALHKFLRFDKPVAAYGDPLQQRMIAASANPEDVLVFISYTGRTIDIIDIAKLAQTRQCHVIGLTAKNSPLAKECSITISTVTPEDTDMYTPMTSRINHLVIIDILATAYALRKGDAFNGHLKSVKEALTQTRMSK